MNTKEFQTLYNINMVETCTAWDTSVFPLPSDAAMEWGKQDSEYYDKKATDIWRHCPYPNLSQSLSLGNSMCGNWKRGLKRAIRDPKDSHQDLRKDLGCTFSTFHQYRPESLLSEVGIPQLGRGSTIHKASNGSSSVNTDKTWEDRMENPLPS